MAKGGNKSKARPKCIIIFMEGDTENLFYKKLVNFFQKDKQKAKNTKIEFKNLKSVTKVTGKAVNSFKNNFLHKHKGAEFHIFFAYDSDVFELGKKPPVNWKEIEKELNTYKEVKKIYHLKAVSMIEDWFLHNLNEILSFLKLSKPSTPLKGKTGNDKLKNLFKKSNKAYIKGSATVDFIDSLNLEIIFEKEKEVLTELKNCIF